MVHISKRKKPLTKKQLATVVAAAALVLLIVAYIVIGAIINAISASQDGGAATPDIDESVGESLYGNYAVAYDVFEDKDVQAIDVSYRTKDNSQDSSKVLRHYSMRRPSKNSDFIFGYTDSNGKLMPYMPPISDTDGFAYSDLYAADSSGYGIYKLSYLIVAVSVMYFDEKMELPAEGAERQRMLLRYGFGEDEVQKINVTYYDGRGEEKKHEILIGDLAIDGSGYYFTVDGRNYIYSSMSTDFDYALGGFTSFIHSRLTAEGLPMDGAQEPYFTQDYRQWKNTLHTEEGELVPDLSKVVFTGVEEEYIYEDINFYEDKGLQSYRGQYSFALDKTAPSKLRKILTGMAVGKLAEKDYKTVTIPGDTNWARVGGEYDYKITDVLAVLTDGEDITDEGYAVSGARYVKIKYNYSYFYQHYIEGNVQTDKGSYEGAVAVVDLNKIDTLIPGDTEGYSAEELAKLGEIKAAFEKIRDSKIGKLDEEISLKVKYSEKISDQFHIKYVITGINMIYGASEDGKVTYIDKVAEDSLVNITYELRNGSEVIDSGSESVDLSAIKEGTLSYKIKSALIGKTYGSNLSIEAYTETLYREYMTDYRTYRIESVDYFVTEELKVSFGFVNASERNPFYGESLFINNLTGKLGTYALDSSACEYVVRLLGGISMDSDSTSSSGLVGNETVAIDLTPANMKEYGLYANTIYFELPRGIEESKITDGDYVFLSTLGFTLYVSDMNPDGSRYVGSDMYDIIVKVDGDDFVFLDKSFVDFFARETLAAVHFEKIDRIDVDFNMSDLKGSYVFDVAHDYKPTFEGSNQMYDYMWVEMSMRGDIAGATDTLVKNKLQSTGKAAIPLYSVYKDVTGSTHFDGLKDYADAVNFKSVLDVIYNTYYTGLIAPEEQSVIKKSGNPLMKFSFVIDDESDEFDKTYVFEFHKADDRRIMVTMYEQYYETDAVSDFYISTQAFKKIAYGFLGLLNGETVDGDVGYPK